MHVVTDDYKAGMKEQLRERGYMEVVFGLINQEAMRNASITDAEDYTYYSNTNGIFDRRETNGVFATLEPDFGRVDGSMLCLPREGAYDPTDTGLTSKTQIAGDGDSFSVCVVLDMNPTDIKGLTLDFPENSYPVDFDVIIDDGTVFEVRDNDTTNYTTEHVFYNTTTLTIVVYKMTFPNTRVRIENLVLGVGLSFGNADIMDSSLQEYVSPICADVPQYDFNVTLQNYDKYFDVDNPDSAINYIETGQEMYIYYGLYIPERDEVEWFQSTRLYCSEWSSDDYQAQITCQDIYRSMDGDYYRGDYSEGGTSLYDLATAVFTDAGFEEDEYYIDPYLQTIYTKNPVPNVSHKEALQMIANAGRCIMTLNNEGQPEILSSFTPDCEISAEHETEYSHAENVKDSEDKCEYASLAGDYGRLDRSQYFLPEDHIAGLYTGYVSEEISDENGLFETNPVLTITLEAQHRYYGFTIHFGMTLPASFIVHTYNNGEEIDTVEVAEEQIDWVTQVYHEFLAFDEMRLEFTSTQKPHNRIIVNHFEFGDVTDFKMERWDMMSSPRAYKEETVTRVDVDYYNYSKGGEESSLTSEIVDVEEGDILEYSYGDPAYGYTVTFDDDASVVSILESSAYWIRIQMNTSGEGQLKITATKFSQSTQVASSSLHPSGSIVEWENPLIDTKELAEDVAVWLAEHYLTSVEYEYDTRGNPELEPNDVIYQENSYEPDMMVRIYDQTIGFNGAFSGSVTARRLTPTKGT